MSDLRSKILDSQDIPKEDFYVPEWDVTVQIHGMNASDRSKILKKVVNQKTGEMDIEALYPMLIQECARDPETGERIFDTSDLPRLNTKSAKALERIGDKAASLSGMKKDENEELGKPSSLNIQTSTPTDDSHLTSPQS